VLSEDERKALEEMERSYGAAGPEPGRLCPGRRQHPLWGGEPALAATVVVIAGSASVFLLVNGVRGGAVAIAAATGLGWLLWRCWPQLRDLDAVAGLPVAGDGRRRNGPEDVARAQPQQDLGKCSEAE
jgi:hypothetical protein